MFDALALQNRLAVPDQRPFLMLPEFRFAVAALQRLVQPGRHTDRSGLVTTLVGPRGSGKTRLISHVLAKPTRKPSKTGYAILPAGEWLQALDQQPTPSAGHYPPILVAEDADRTLTSPEQSDAFARWLDDLLQHRVRVLVTLSEPAGQVTALTARLVSRLHAGLCVRLPALSLDSRRELVRTVAQSAPVALPDETLNWIADQPPGTCRSLIRLIERAASTGSTAAGEPNLAEVHGQRPALTVIAAEVAADFGVPIGDLRSESREQALQLPRRCAMWLAHEAAWPMAQIGRFFGRRTHASVSYSCRELQRQLDKMPTLRDRVQRLQSRLAEGQREDCG